MTYHSLNRKVAVGHSQSFNPYQEFPLSRIHTQSLNQKY